MNLRFACSRVLGGLLALCLVCPPSCAGPVVLKRAWVEKYKNRVTLDSVEFFVDHAHVSPNSIKDDGDDGDLHFAGRAPGIGLPMVAEIVNAKMAAQQPAINLVHALEAKTKQGNPQATALSGVWRFWFEHPANVEQKQGEEVLPAKNTNPDHVFELHPMTTAGTTATLGSFVPIPQFRAYDAETAFSYFDGIQATIQANSSAVRITAPKAKYNYVEFKIELMQNPLSEKAKVKDGIIVRAKVLTMEGNSASKAPRRMVFMKGTPAAAALQGKKKGDVLRVLGIPRVNLAEVMVLVKQNGENAFPTDLPYEMIIVGVIQ